LRFASLTSLADQARRYRLPAFRAYLFLPLQTVHQVTRNLSGGNQQKIVLGKWLATKPRLLIVDEPTRGIDVGARAEIHRLLDRLAREENMAILVISSDLPEILRLSDRIYVMREGYLVAEFARNKATQENILAAAVGQRTNGDSNASTIPEQ
jgi:rhamnose transport system ATP-binding protein